MNIQMRSILSAYLSELHLIHALSSVPVKEGLATKHGPKLLTHALEQLLNGRTVANKGAGHFEPAWSNVAHGRLHVVGDPLDEVRTVFFLYVEHLLVDLLHRHSPAENCGDGEIPPVTWIAGSHHVFSVKHLLREFGHGESSVGLRRAAGQRSKSRHEEMEARKRDHIDGKLTQVRVELSGKPQARCDTTHRVRHQVIQIAVRGVREFERTEADVVKSFVVDAVTLVRVLYELMYGESGVVRLNDSVRDLRRGYHTVSVHDAVGIFFTDL